MIHLIKVTFLLLSSFVAAANAQTNDDALSEIKCISLPGITITEVQNVPAGSFTTPGKKVIHDLPGFIRVALISKPSPESSIRIEVWLPGENWNGRFLGTGNGGEAGSIVYSSLASGIRRGFATANTDLGTSPGTNKAIGNRELWADFGYRATHEMTAASKAIIEAFYKKPAHHSYFLGCSTGGHQALSEAQRYPEDYDGIAAGAPGNNRTHLHALFVWNLQAVDPAAGGTPVSPKKMELLSKLIIRDCNGKDGGAPMDKFLTDPRMYKFDSQILPECPDDTHSDSCFTTGEKAAIKKLFDGPLNPRTGERIYTGLPIGGSYLANTLGSLYILRWVFGKSFDYTKFDFDKDMAKLDTELAPLVNANNPDLDKLKKRGGKLLMYAGTFDQHVPFQDALNYYERVVEKQHGLKKTQDFFRLFLVPGMAHCSGGPGLTEFGQSLSSEVKQDREHDLMTAMIDWVEKKIAPEKMIANTFNCCDSVNSISSQRPLYPYPEFPEYKNGGKDIESSYRSSIHKRGAVDKPASVYLN